MCNACNKRPRAKGKLMCKECWRQVPAYLQGKVYQTNEDRETLGGLETVKAWAKASAEAVAAVNPRSIKLLSLWNMAEMPIDPDVRAEILKANGVQSNG